MIFHGLNGSRKTSQYEIASKCVCNSINLSKLIPLFEAIDTILWSFGHSIAQRNESHSHVFSAKILDTSHSVQVRNISCFAVNIHPDTYIYFAHTCF